MSVDPRQEDSQPAPSEPRILELESDVADLAFETLRSSTARTILSIIYEQPSISTEIRDEIETSLQNVHYHLEKLEDVGLIEPSGSDYSDKGTEMTVYAPAYEAVMLVAGRDAAHRRLQDVLP